MHSINVVCIAKDTEKTIQRLIHSVSTLVDKVIVVDTGSSDRTVEVAQAGGAELHFFKWTNDFSAARNFSLDQSGADWNIVLDSDEWLESDNGFIQALRTLPPNKTFQAQIKNYSDDGTLIDKAFMQRVFPKGLRYKGIVHEQVQHTLPIERCDLVIAHDGYGEKGLARKKGRNMALLKEAVKHSPSDAYLWFQLGNQAVVDDDYGLAVDAYLKFLTLNKAQRTVGEEFHQSISGSVFALKKLNRHEEGLNLGMDYLEQCRHCPDVLFSIGDLLLDWAATQPDLASQLLPHAVDAFKQCLEIGDTPQVTASVQGRGSQFAQHNLDLIKQFYPQAFEG